MQQISADCVDKGVIYVSAWQIRADTMMFRTLGACLCVGALDCVTQSLLRDKPERGSLLSVYSFAV